jgi:hypothetical protein
VSDPTAVTVGGRPVAQAEGIKVLPREAAESRFEIGAGDYEFSMPWKIGDVPPPAESPPTILYKN